MKARSARAYWECLPIVVVVLACSACICRLRFTPAVVGFADRAGAGRLVCYTSKSCPARRHLADHSCSSALPGLLAGGSAAAESWDRAVYAADLGWLLASIVIATSLRFGLQMKGQKYAAVASAAIIMVLSRC